MICWTLVSLTFIIELLRCAVKRIIFIVTMNNFADSAN